MAQIKYKTVMFYDHNWSHISRIVESFAYLVKDLNIRIILLSDRKPSLKKGNLEVLNIYDIKQYKTLQELQDNYSFSLHKSLVPERAFYDYTSFRRSQCYSKLSEDQIAKKITPYVNAIDYLIREKVDLIIEWFPDNFLSSMIPKIASEYKKRCVFFLPYYWWKDGAIILDRPDMTSTVVDKNYDFFYKNPDKIDLERLKNVYAAKKSLFFFKQSQMYLWKDRFSLILNRERSYQPVSLSHWIFRRLSTKLSNPFVKLISRQEVSPRDENFLVYPLHISPEAAILGPSPELADQFSLIKNISMNLPYGTKLYVKRHPLELGGLRMSFDFYQKMNSLPNVRIFRSNSNLNELIDHPRCIAVAVLTGTAAIEAAMKRKPVFIFGKSFFSRADCFIKPTDFHDFYRKLEIIIKGRYQCDEKAINAMLAALDKSVVRANIDIAAQTTTTDFASQLSYIWASYVKTEFF